MRCPAFEVLLEGTRGGGKSDVLLMDFLQFVGQGYGRDWRGILFRQSSEMGTKPLRRVRVKAPANPIRGVDETIHVNTCCNVGLGCDGETQQGHRLGYNDASGAPPPCSAHGVSSGRVVECP